MKLSNEFLNFLGFWVINAIVLLIASFTAKGQVVIGNVIPTYFALIWTSLLLTVAISLVQPILKAVKIEIVNEIYIGLLYLVVNIVALWVLARLAFITGFGISSFWVAIILGIILNILQYGFWKWSSQIRKDLSK